MSKKRSAATRRAESQAAQERAAAIRAEHDQKERRRRNIQAAAVVASVLAIVLVVGTIYLSTRDTSGESAAAPAGAAADGNAVPAGSADAPVTVTVYEDFICPFCGQFETAAQQELSDDIDAGRVRFEYHPLNFLSQASSTDYSLRAANALGVVLDASGSEVAAEFHDQLFANQPEEGGAGLDDDELVDLAVEAGATESEVRPGIEDRAFEQWVENVTDQASRDGVNSTPTVMIDGETLEFRTVDELVSKVQEAIDDAQ